MFVFFKNQNNLILFWLFESLCDTYSGSLEPDEVLLAKA